MMKFLSTLSILAYWFLTIPSYSQTIKGVVVDEHHKPLPYANVTLLTLPDSTFLTGTVSADDGSFTLKGDNSRPSTLVRISSIGYVTVYKSPGTDLGMITLQPDAYLLQEVVVKSRLPVMRIQKDAFVTTVQNSVLAEAGSAGDVLARLPSVTRKSGDEFEVFGKGTPLIYINGRKVRNMDELEQLSSSDIKQVEVITSPGARYDASVKSVVRIQTLRRKGDGFGLSLRSTYNYAERSQWHEQADVNYRHGDLDLFGSLTYRNTTYLQDSEINQETQADAVWQQENVMDNTVRSERMEFLTGLNYTWGKDNSIGMRYSLSKKIDVRSRLNTVSRVWKDGEFYDNWSSLSSTDGDYRPTHLLNAYYSGRVRNLSVSWDADYYDERSDEHNLTDEDSQEQDDREVGSTNHIDNKLVATKLTLSHPLAGGTISFGGEYSYTRRQDDYLSETDLLPTSYSRIREHNAAVYVEYGRPLFGGLLSAGLRYEHVDFDYYENDSWSEEKSRSYDDFFPNVSYAVEAGGVQVQASYTSKVERPSYQDLSNNVSYVNRFTLQTGNPALKPTVVHDVQLNVAWRFLMGMVSYQRRTDDMIYWGEQVTDNQAVTKVQNKNVDCIPMLTAYLGGSPKIGIWSSNIGVGVSKQWLTLETAVGSKDMRKPMWTANFGNTFSLSGDWRVNVDLSYQGTGHYQNVYMSRDIYSCDMAVRKSWWKDMLSVELRGNDLFHSRKNGNVVQVDRLLIDQRNVINTREFVCTLRYKFNSVRSKYKGKGAGQEEIKRF